MYPRPPYDFSLNGRIRIGTGDLVATGMLYGGYWATRFVLRASRIFIDIKPDFDRKILEMDMTIRIPVNHPFRLHIAGIRLYRNPDIIQGMTFLKPDSPGVAKS